VTLSAIGCACQLAESIRDLNGNMKKQIKKYPLTHLTFYLFKSFPYTSLIGVILICDYGFSSCSRYHTHHLAT